MVLNKKRGQAALEFLTTYGWAFLVILVMISALGYFGILNPDRFLPERCNVGPEFACVEYAIFDNGTLDLIISNSIGLTLTNFTINRVQVRNAVEDDRSGHSCIAYTTEAGSDEPSEDEVSSDESVRASENIWIRCNALSTDLQGQFGSIGSKVRVDLDATYRALGRSLDRPVAIQVYATLQE
ncbi:MAG: hypothetical protein ACMXX9_04025 [Candidatus Woesearchaeota archaeon]